MTKNKIHCLIINEPKSLKPALAGMFDKWEGSVIVEVSRNIPSSIIKKLVSGNINLVFTSSNDKARLEKYRNLLRRYSNDTILINQSIKNRPLLRDLTGIESCSIYLGDTTNSPILINNLLSYTQIKKDFRKCKHLLSVTDQRNRWLVNITSEPIAYIYKGTHIHANAAYLSIFGFQSVAELKSASIWDLVPEKSQNMFKKFIKKQLRQMDMQQTLLMTMNTTDRTQIRTSIRIAPAVIYKTKCLQVWIHKIDDDLGKIESRVNNQKSQTPASPWENLPEKKAVISQQRSTESKPQLSNKIKRELSIIKLKLLPLTDPGATVIRHYLATLVLDAYDQSRITQRLKESGVTSTAMFWDRLLFSKLSSELRDNHQTDNQYLLSLTSTSFRSNSFIHFLLRSVKALPEKHPNIVFLVPYDAYKPHHQRVIKINATLHTMNSSLGIYNFVPDKQSLQRILTDKPSYLSFSSKWVAKLATNKIKYNKFMQLTEKLETTGIQVILS